MEATSLLWILVALLVATGIVGVIVPVLPGSVLVFAGLLLGAWIDGFVYVGRGTLIALAALAGFAYAIDFAASAVGAQRFGAHPRALLGAGLGALAGIFLGLPGIVLGPFVGAALGEFSARGDLEGAGRVGVATWVGMLVGGALKLATVLAMLGLFLFQRFH